MKEVKILNMMLVEDEITIAKFDLVLGALIVLNGLGLGRASDGERVAYCIVLPNLDEEIEPRSEEPVATFDFYEDSDGDLGNLSGQLCHSILQAAVCEYEKILRTQSNEHRSEQQGMRDESNSTVSRPRESLDIPSLLKRAEPSLPFVMVSVKSEDR